MSPTPLTSLSPRCAPFEKWPSVDGAVTCSD
jgi:hypothetical protein